MTNPKQWPFGFILHTDPIGAAEGPNGCALDWAAIQLSKDTLTSRFVPPHHCMLLHRCRTFWLIYLLPLSSILWREATCASSTCPNSSHLLVLHPPHRCLPSLPQQRRHAHVGPRWHHVSLQPGAAHRKQVNQITAQPPMVQMHLFPYSLFYL
jgi:hypothetical protein